MNLRRVRLQLTLIYGVLSAVAVAAMAWYALALATDSITDSAEREAETVVRNLAIDSFDTTEGGPSNTWVVNLADGWVNPLGDTSVEPPLVTIAEQTYGSSRFSRFEFESSTFLAYAQPLANEQVVVTALDFESYESDIASIRWRIVLAALGSIVAAAAAGYWVAGRSLQPARMAMAQQRDFIADAAHELRTPLAIIQASASHTLSRPREGAAYVESLEEIRTAAERAGVGVSELLELARLEAGQATPRKAPLRLDLLAEEVGASIRGEGVVVTAEAGEALVVDADYTLLRQVVETLTRNAVSRADMVTLKSSRVNGEGVIQISDDGPGFAPEVLPHVFDRFRRGDTGGSSGLGLAIAKSIIDLHQGRIEVGNGEDGGAVVKVTLPVSSGP